MLAVTSVLVLDALFKLLWDYGLGIALDDVRYELFERHRVTFSRGREFMCYVDVVCLIIISTNALIEKYVMFKFKSSDRLSLSAYNLFVKIGFLSLCKKGLL